MEKKYQIVYADPPWHYNDQTCRGAASRHYPTMELDELLLLPVGKLAHPDGCHLWVWVTWPKIRDGWLHRLFEAWGFKWKTEMTWDKQVMGPGRYLRKQTEVLCLGVTHKMRLLTKDQIDIVHEPRSQNHSEKPERFRKIIERMSPGPRIELFARKEALGWDRWGLQA